MFSSIVIAILAVAGGVTIYNHWDEVCNWCSDFIHAVAHLFKTVFRGVAHATAVFVRITRDGLAELTHKTYAPMENGQFGEIEVKKTTTIPLWARQMIEAQQINGQAVKLTDEQLLQLGLTK